jgi:hypothetical protein
MKHFIAVLFISIAIQAAGQVAKPVSTFAAIVANDATTKGSSGSVLVGPIRVNNF